MSDIEPRQSGKDDRAPMETPVDGKQKKTGKKKLRIALGAVAALLILAVATLLAIKVIVPNLRYRAAVQLYEDGKYEEAIAAFKALDGYMDSDELARDAAYGAAVELYEAGKFEEAIAAFRALDGYRDSEAQLENCYIGKYGEEQYHQILNLQPGDTYTFGAYEQDNDMANGKEPLEWIVLERDGNNVMLISKYALDCQPYHDPYANVTWETCYLRGWLNDTFLNEAFNPEEQNSILITTVTADSNPAYSVSPGNDTCDKVYLLSIPEANTYFATDADRQCKGTEYCYAQGVAKDDDGNSWWLLRSPGYESRLAAFVNSYGSISNRGDGVNHTRSAIRPVIWINLLP
ncbi:MAG: hypothetical protein IJK63_12275 [Oscillospiraceae bacterium]|nr:hypothetical protein [Oscillospiraceae bacterium]